MSISEIGADVTAVESRDFGNGRLRCRIGFISRRLVWLVFECRRKAGQSKRRALYQMSGTAPCDIIVEFDETRASALRAPAGRFRLLRCPGGSFLDSQFLEHQFVLDDEIVSCRQILPVSRIGF
jgi:hypothetical protein